MGSITESKAGGVVSAKLPIAVLYRGEKQGIHRKPGVPIKERSMGRETRLFKIEERENRSDVSVFLHQLADKVSAGELVISKGNEDIKLQLPQNLVLEEQVEDEDKGARGIQHSLELEIKWFDGDDQGGTLELK